jgi:inosine-uridine nucleoside N-ribohydrolase
MSQPELSPIFIDTDMGCDDAAGLAWLLSRPEAQIVGISSVFGNSTVENTTANVLTLLGAMGVTLPVTVGARAPLAYPYNRVGGFIHGPDGFWGAQEPQDLAGLPDDAPGAIAAAARAHPGLTVLALGPLTNVARAAQAYPADLAGVRLVALAGARAAGNVTPTAEFNAFADPHALAAVLESQMQVELLTCDAFEMVLVEVEALGAKLALAGRRGAKLLARLLESYSLASGRDKRGRMAIPDMAAAIYALRPDLGEATPALVRVVVDGELTRGQTIIALTPEHQISLALGATGIARLAERAGSPDFQVGATMGAILGQLPQNVRAVLRVDAAAMGGLLVEGLMAMGRERAIGG